MHNGKKKYIHTDFLFFYVTIINIEKLTQPIHI